MSCSQNEYHLSLLEWCATLQESSTKELPERVAHKKSTCMLRIEGLVFKKLGVKDEATIWQEVREAFDCHKELPPPSQYTSQELIYRRFRVEEARKNIAHPSQWDLKTIHEIKTGSSSSLESFTFHFDRSGLEELLTYEYGHAKWKQCLKEFALSSTLRSIRTPLFLVYDYLLLEERVSAVIPALISALPASESDFLYALQLEIGLRKRLCEATQKFNRAALRVLFRGDSALTLRVMQKNIEWCQAALSYCRRGIVPHKNCSHLHGVKTLMRASEPVHFPLIDLYEIPEEIPSLDILLAQNTETV